MKMIISVKVKILRLEREFKNADAHTQTKCSKQDDHKHVELMLVGGNGLLIEK